MKWEMKITVAKEENSLDKHAITTIVHLLVHSCNVNTKPHDTYNTVGWYNEN